MNYKEKVKYFDLEKTMESGQVFHYEKLGTQKYLVYGQNTICIAEQKEDELIIETEEKDIKYWKTYFSLDINYEDIVDDLIKFAKENKDEFALKSIEIGQGIRILRQPFFETCCSYILSQRNNIPRIKNMVKGLSETYSTNVVSYNGEDYYCFPNKSDLEKISESDLRKLSLGYRAEYLKLFVDRWDEIFDSVSFKYEKDFELFKSCKGIGDKVSNCICLYGFSEYDAFPIDVWMQKIIDEEYKSKGKELKIPDTYAGILQQFMFYTKRQEKEKI